MLNSIFNIIFLRKRQVLKNHPLIRQPSNFEGGCFLWLISIGSKTHFGYSDYYEENSLM